MFLPLTDSFQRLALCICLLMSDYSSLGLLVSWRLSSCFRNASPYGFPNCRLDGLPGWCSWDIRIELEDLLLQWRLSTQCIFSNDALGPTSFCGVRAKGRVDDVGDIRQRHSPASHHSNGMRRGRYGHSCHAQRAAVPCRAPA